MTLVTGKNYPVKVRTGFAKRVQDFSTDKSRTLDPYYEMGNATPTGVAADQKQFTASLSWFPIDNSIEESIAGDSGVITLNDIVNAAIMDVESKYAGISGARVTSLEYSCQVGGEFRASAQLRGTEYTDGDPEITATAPTGAAVFKAKDVVVVSGSTRGVRVQGFSLNIQIPAEDNYELSEENPFEITLDNPNVSLDIDWYEDTVAAGMAEPDTTAPRDFIIAVGGTSKKITVKNCAWTGVSHAGRVKGAATRKYRYRGGVDAATGGVSFDTNTAPATCTLAASPVSPQVSSTLVTLTATVGADTDGIYRVDFYNGTILIGSDSTTPFTCTWVPGTAGVYSLTAVAQDTFGARKVSSPLSFTAT